MLFSIGFRLEPSLFAYDNLDWIFNLPIAAKLVCVFKISFYLD